MTKHFSPTELESVGYRLLYRANEVNHCPGCGKMHWFVGRRTAECAFCGTALPLLNSMLPDLMDPA